MPSVTDNAVYNSRIAGMLTPSSLRRFRFALILPTLLLATTTWAQDWPGSEEQLARKIVAVTGPRTMLVEVANRSSLAGDSADDVRRGLLTQVASMGGRFAAADQATATVRISLSENIQSYIWVAEIQVRTDQQAGQAGNNSSQPTVVIVSVPRPITTPVAPVAATVLHKISLWSQTERILDVAIVDRSPDGNPAHMLVLDSNRTVFYAMQNGRWQAEQSLAITHARPWPRDLRGRLQVRKDRLFDAYLPGVICRSGGASPVTMACSESNDDWPIGTSLFNLNAGFVSTRNYFSGTVSPGVGRQSAVSPFYSAAVFPHGEAMFGVFTGVDGRVYLLDGVTDQAIPAVMGGSDIASVRSGCGSGWQVLATKSGEESRDAVRAYEVSGREIEAVSADLEMPGSITTLWTEPGESGVVAVVRNAETGRYEAFRLTLACSR